MAEVKGVHEIITEVLKKTGSKWKGEEYKLVYDSTTEALEQIYFFILDLTEDNGYKTEKLIDNFTSSPGSTHFADMGQRLTRMQEEAMKIGATINAIMRSVLNLVYDMKDMRSRLEYYKDLKSENKETKSAARLTLKQIWLDKVDIQKGNSSISMMARQLGFQTLFDAFYAADNPEEAEKLDLNDRVKRTVKSRLEEFDTWLKFSDQELKKRYEMEKNYLKTQMATLKLYSRWIRPYLKSAQNLSMLERNRSSELVNIFNTVVLELSLLGKKELKIDSSVVSGDLPPEFPKLKVRRKYYSVVLIDLHFRGIPMQGRFGGRTEVTFRSYSLNEDEIAMINKEMDNSDFENVTKLMGSNDDSFKALEEDIKSFLEEEIPEGKRDEMTKEDANPFLALFGFYSKKESKKDNKKQKKKTERELKDTWIEKNYLRRVTQDNANRTLFNIFDIYKKSHGMPSYS